MKKVWFGFAIMMLLLSIFSTDANAQRRRPRSIIIFSLSDGSPLTIAINERYFQKIAGSITLKDLPGKKPFIKVYQFHPYKDEKGGKAELLFSGSIKIEPGKSYRAVVNPDTRQLSLTEINPQELTDIQPSQEENNYDMSTMDTVQTMPQIEYLRKQMERQTADMDKLKLAKSYVDNNNYNTDDVKSIASFLLFDDTKMDFVKYAYKKVSDASNYAELENIFSQDSDQQAFRNYLQSAK